MEATAFTLSNPSFHSIAFPLKRKDIFEGTVTGAEWYEEFPFDRLPPEEEGSVSPDGRRRYEPFCFHSIAFPLKRKG